MELSVSKSIELPVSKSSSSATSPTASSRTLSSGKYSTSKYSTSKYSTSKYSTSKYSRSIFSRSKTGSKTSETDLDESYCISKIPGEQEEYDVFRYLEQLAVESGADRYTYVTLPTLYKDLIELIVPESINLQDGLGQTVLHLAAQYCSADSVETFINSGAGVNQEDHIGYTPLFYAIMANNASTVTKLVEKGASVSCEGFKCQRTPIHLAAVYGSVDILTLLIEKGGGVNARDCMGLTPICLAAYYRNSELVALLLEKGADTFALDHNNVPAAVRMASTMPTVIRDVFDKLVTEDLYQGERYYEIKPLVDDIAANFNTSLYHFLVWKSSIGIIEHPVFKYLNNAKWEMYGQKPAKHHFLFLFLFLSIWTIIYLFDNLDINYITHEHYLHLLVYLFGIVLYFIRYHANYSLIKSRYRYNMFLQKLFRSTNAHENEVMHWKSKYLMEAINKKAKKSKISFLDDVKSCPSLFMDFVVDNLLIIYLIVKIADMVFISPEENRLTDALNLFGAVNISMAWFSCFMKLQITKKVGPFVIFIKYAQKDLYTISSMFITLFIPALLVFFKTIYQNEAHEAHVQNTVPDDVVDENVVEDTVKRVVRAAAKSKGKGNQGFDGLRGSLTLYGTFFVVLRMVLGDYDYDDGLKRSGNTHKIWWMSISLIWIIISSVIVLNLLIALMSDSYTRIFSTAEIQARMERARFICDLERKMTPDQLKMHNGYISADSPVKVMFDPVCDRDKVDVVEEKVRGLSQKVTKLENIIKHDIFLHLTSKLDAIDETLNLYTPSQSY